MVHWRDISQTRFDLEYKEKRPLLVQTGLEFNGRFRRAVERESLLRDFGNITISIGTAESYTGRRAMAVTLHEYITGMMKPQTEHSLGNETYYLFGQNT